MRLVYVSSESSKFMSDLKTNLNAGKEAMNQLKTGSQKVVSAVDGHQLAGAAYTAGKGLFSELIIPTITRTTNALEKVEQELQTYKTADSFVSGEGKLDEDKLIKEIQTLQSMKHSIDSTRDFVQSMSRNHPVADMIDTFLGIQRNLTRQSETMQSNIKDVEKKLRMLREFNGKTSSLFQNSLNELKIAMQGVMVLNNTTVNADGSYSLPSGIDKSWFTQIKPNAKAEIDAYSSNAFLDLYKNVKELMDPLTSGKTDNMKRLDQLLALYPKALVDKLMKNDEFWMLADKLPPKYQTKLINGLAKYESFGQAVAKGKWIPKIDTIGKGYEWFNKLTNPIKTYVSEGLKNSKFVQGAKNLGVAKGIGTVAQVATYAQLGVTFVSSGVNEYGKTGSIGKGVIGGAIDTVKSVGPLEGITIGAAVAGPPGAIVGGIVGGANKLAQFIWPNAYDNAKNWSYDAYDKASKVGKDVSKKVGKAVAQGVDTVKHVYKDVQHVGKSIGEALSSVKLPKISFGW
ncbi:T7SS effector LXG polymorphic toxin [Enterococcus faecalis]|nr:T7SS effector LXG polymorphic toxin [Enterococcus faecalis]